MRLESEQNRHPKKIDLSKFNQSIGDFGTQRNENR